MRRSPKTESARRALVLACFLLGAAAPAAAYIDPGTGSMLLQVIGASIAGSLFYFRELRMKLFSMLGRRGAQPTGSESASSTDEAAR